MASILSYQPAKAIWTALTILSLTIRLPFTALYFLPKSLRPHPEWSHRQALGNTLLKMWFQYAVAIRFKVPTTLEPGAEKDRFVVLEPAKPTETLYRDVLDDSDVRPATIGGTWFPEQYDSTRHGSKKVLLHFHGGAYVLGGARTQDCGFGADTLIQNLPDTLAFFPQYRLASRSNGRFPAPIQDAVTSYKYLLDAGVPASKIFLSGDSAGGNLAVSLLRYLSETTVLPLPAATLLWSPWVDLVVEAPSFDQHRNSKSDFVGSSLANWTYTAYIPPGVDRSHPYISPSHHAFLSKPPMFIQVGEVEVLKDQITKFAEDMEKIQGNNVELYEIPHAPHDIILCGQILGWEKGAGDAVRAARNFLEKQGL